MLAAALLYPAASAAATPLGGAIVYPTTSPEGFGGQYDGGLKVDRGAAPTGPSTWLTTDPAQAEPAISPDGKTIAFAYDSDEVGYAGPLGIAVVDSSGGTPSSLTDGRHDTGPAFSPQGTLLAFSRQGSIFLIGSDGSGLRQLTRDPKGRDKNPAFAAGGSKVAFTRTYSRAGHQTSGIYWVSVNGGPVRKLLDGATPEAEPAFSTDGRRMAYAADGALMLAQADGTHPRRLNSAFRRFSEAHAGAAPAFSPDGRYLVFLASGIGGGSYEQRLAVLRVSGEPKLMGTIARAAGDVEGGSALGPPAWGIEP
jgi:dipeptidyl aminopeptidase/acylaminoacyl peptidase